MITTEQSVSNKLYIILKLNRLLFLICLFSIMLIITSLIYIVFKVIFIKKLDFNKVNNNNEECSICLEPMDKNTIVITYCNHTFHDDCIKKMLDYNNKCPLCRRIL
jgi:hypothetical protein|uniref:RING-type E3 ubiquitin transferase n=1 Tax=viral metagenome TaxID=1070528 RepID=A0A6C0LFA7_9ZZZZ